MITLDFFRCVHIPVVTDDDMWHGFYERPRDTLHRIAANIADLFQTDICVGYAHDDELQRTLIVEHS